MAKIDGAVIIARLLKEQGVDKVFGLTGGHIFRLEQECQKLGIQVIDVRNEAAAFHAAMTYSKTQDKLSVVILTAGPGVMNAYYGFVDAAMSQYPMLVIGGAAPTSSDGTRAMQEVDQLGPVRAAGAKFAARVSDNKMLARMVQNAIREALSPRRGLAYLDVPCELLVDDRYLVEDEPATYDGGKVYPVRCAADPVLIEKAAELLVSKENGVIVMGNLAMWDHQDKTVYQELAEYLQYPVSTLGGEWANYLDAGHPLVYGSLAAPGMAEIALCFGCVSDYNSHNLGSINPQATLIEVCDTGEELGYVRGGDMGILGTCDMAARQLLDAVKAKMEPRRTETSAWVQKMLHITPMATGGYQQGSAALENAEVMHPQILADCVASWLEGPGAECDFLADGGDCCVYYNTAFTMDTKLWSRPNRAVYTQFKLGGIGWGQPTAIGLALGTKNPVVLCTGDGAQGEFMGEYFTMAKFGLPIITVISNNGAWNMIRSFAEVKYKDEDNSVGIDLKAVDGSSFHYEKIAESWGGYGAFVTDKDDIAEALSKALESAKAGKPAIINVVTGTDMAPKFSVDTAKELYGMV